MERRKERSVGRREKAGREGGGNATGCRRKKAANTVRKSKDSKNREEDAEMKEEMHVSPAAV